MLNSLLSIMPYIFSLHFSHENSNFRSHRTHRSYHEIYNFSTCFLTYAVCCIPLTSFSISLFILSFMVSFASSLKCTLTTYIVPPICFLSATGVCDFVFSFLFFRSFLPHRTIHLFFLSPHYENNGTVYCFCNIQCRYF